MGRFLLPRSRVTVFTPLVLTAVVGCSSGSFAVGGVDEDTGTTEPDAQTESGPGPDATPESGPDGGPDDGGPDPGPDGGPDATPESGSDGSADGCVPNACGGCAVLTNAPGGSCGVCSSGAFACNGPDATKCNDPVTTAAPGTKCGVCDTGAFACADDKKSTVCVDPVKTPPPGTVCGVCNGGKFECVTGGAGTACNDPVKTPAPGTKCGDFCNASSFVCASGGSTTVCAKPDDRTPGTDTYFGTDSGKIIVLGNDQPVAVAFKLRRAGAVQKVVLSLGASDTGVSKVAGTLRVRLLKGFPSLSPPSSDLLATVDIPATSIAGGVTSVIEIPIATAQLPKDAQLWLEIRDQSPQFEIAILGGARTAPADHSFWIVDYSVTPKWIEYPLDYAYFKVGLNGCF